MDCMASRVYDKTRELAAFNLCHNEVVKVSGNQYGKWYYYSDDSKFFLGKDLNAKFITPYGMCLAARIGPNGRYTKTTYMVSPNKGN